MAFAFVNPRRFLFYWILFQLYPNLRFPSWNSRRSQRSSFLYAAFCVFLVNSKHPRNHHPNQGRKHRLQSQRAPRAALCFSPLPNPRQPRIWSLQVSFSCYRISHRWNGMVYTSLYLDSSTPCEPLVHAFALLIAACSSVALPHLFTHSPVEGLLVTSSILVVTNKAAINTQHQIVVWTDAFISLG